MCRTCYSAPNICSSLPEHWPMVRDHHATSAWYRDARSCGRSADATTAALAPAGRAPAVFGNGLRRLVGARHAVAALAIQLTGHHWPGCLSCGNCWDCCAMASLGSSTVAMIRVFNMMIVGRCNGCKGRPVNANPRGPRAWRKPASTQTCGGHPGRWRHTRSRSTNCKIPIGGAGFGD
jgi:hypothetical protein